jgi:DNA-directed RNA polymerase specialized sigma24 family protein
MGLTTQWSQIEQLKGSAAPEAWEWFIDRYRGFVAAALRRLVWSPDRAAQASEEFWGYLFQSGAVARLERQPRFRAFLVGTLRNYAHDWMRRNPRPSHDAAETLPDPGTTWPEDEEIAMWAHQVLHLALQRLDREHPRDVEMLRSFYGLPSSAGGAPVPRRRATDLAAALGCKANALHQLLFRARVRLRDSVVEEVRHTVSTLNDLKSELNVLLEALGRARPGLVAEDA